MASENIETAFNAAIEAGKVNGGIIIATDAAGNFTYNKAIGTRTLLSGEKVAQKTDDVCYLASATKLITTIAALQLVEDGHLTLTGDLSSIFPELTAKQVLVPKEGEEPALEPQASKITLEQLLTHSSGLSYDFLTPPLAQWTAKNAPYKEGTQRGVEEAFSYPLGFQPGTSWMYGSSLDFAGRLVELVTGRTLGEHVAQRIFGPLGITDGQFYPVTREDLRARMVDLNPEDPLGTGKAVGGGNGDINTRSKGDFGGHGLFIAANDYAKVLLSLLANDGKVLKPKTVDDMFENHLSPEATAGHQAALASPAGVFFGCGINTASTKAGHGLGGILTLEDVDGWYGEKTMTWGGGMTFAWFIDRKNDLCGLGAVQASLPFDMMTSANLKDTFRHDVYRKREAWKKEQVK